MNQHDVAVYAQWAIYDAPEYDIHSMSFNKVTGVCMVKASMADDLENGIMGCGSDMDEAKDDWNRKHARTDG